MHIRGVICTPYTPGELWWSTLLENALQPSPIKFLLQDAELPYKEYALTVVGPINHVHCPSFRLPSPQTRGYTPLDDLAHSAHSHNL
eukprot:2882697-Rhodomonas_salina.1